MKEKPYVKVAMYALNIIFAIIIIVPVIYWIISVGLLLVGLLCYPIFRKSHK